MFLSSVFPLPAPTRPLRHSRRDRVVLKRPQRPIPAVSVASGVALGDWLAIMGAAVLARLASADNPPWSVTLLSGLGLATLFAGLSLLRHDYAAETLVSGRGTMGRVLSTWMLAVAGTLALAFVTKSSSDFSRAANTLLMAGSLPLVLVARIIDVRLARRWAAKGRLDVKRLMIVGGEAETLAFLAGRDPAAFGLRLVGGAVLRQDPATLDDDLALAVATARIRRADDILLLLPWDDQALIGRCVEALRRLPAAIHLGSSPMLARYLELGAERNTPLPAIQLVREPLSSADLLAKRLFDIGASAAGLALLSPLFLAIAIAIKLDSRGPVFFRQRRTGYNQQPFRIFKFRSMSTLEDSAALRQVTSGDTRVTRIGRILRRTSLDELPQLVNVLRGEMSLIGPRPHALAHDRLFARHHDLYDRRHNMRPGITGWAQVSGFRGETDSPDKIEGRVRYDLDYIDNWSFWLDLRILARTVLSPQTFQGAK